MCTRSKLLHNEMFIKKFQLISLKKIVTILITVGHKKVNKISFTDMSSSHFVTKNYLHKAPCLCSVHIMLALKACCQTQKKQLVNCATKRKNNKRFRWLNLMKPSITSSYADLNKTQKKTSSILFSDRRKQSSRLSASARKAAAVRKWHVKWVF